MLAPVEYWQRADGLHWETAPLPLLRHQTADWTSSTLYRAALLYDQTRDVVQVYASARGRDARWGIGRAEYRYADLMRALERQQSPIRSRGRIGEHHS